MSARGFTPVEVLVRARGFTLVEVLVALLILQVGLLGIVGTLVLASRTVARAALLEGAVGGVERVLDSLSGEPIPEDGVRTAPGGTLEWRVSLDGEVSVAFRGETGWPVLEVQSHLGSGGLP